MGNHWKNWSGSVRFEAEQVAYPASEEEVVELVRRAAREKKKIRVVGAGHSFTPLIPTNQILVSLDKWSGLISVDREAGTAVVKAGTRLKDLGVLLHEQGLAMENLGDIDVQSIAGAMSTGTHGTGIDFGTLATQAIGITLVNAQGELVHLRPDTHPEVFRAAQVSFGTLGIITRLELRLLPAYKLRYTSGKTTVEGMFAQLESLKQKHRNFEFYYYPYSDFVQTKVSDVTDEPNKGEGFSTWFSDIFMDNGLFWVVSRLSRHLGLYKYASWLSGWGVSTGTRINWSHKVFATKRLVRFQEMEYNIPAEHFEAVFREVLETIHRDKHRVHFPIECRWVKGDDIWLSPAHGRDSAYIAVHMYKGMPHEKYFKAMEAIFRKYGGRPHWGKMHHLRKKDLAQAYPKWNDFLALRKEWDPEGMFLNGYLSEWMETRSETTVQHPPISS